LIAHADKGKTTVIMYTQDYTNKVHTFLSENNFRMLPNNRTHKDHKTVYMTLQKCDKIVDKKHIKYLIQKNPSPPTLNDLLKLHKPNIPIRPVVNNKTAPAYKNSKEVKHYPKQHPAPGKPVQSCQFQHSSQRSDTNENQQ
jgi:hypothetical protein